MGSINPPGLQFQWQWRRPLRSQDFTELEELQSLLSNFHNLSIEQDRWDCLIDNSRLFSVKGMRTLIINSSTQIQSAPTRWNKLVPIKVNISTWRMENKRIPTRVNLDNNGIDLDSVRCPICDDNLESEDHILVNCNVASRCWPSTVNPREASGREQSTTTDPTATSDGGVSNREAGIRNLSQPRGGPDVRVVPIRVSTLPPGLASSEPRRSSVSIVYPVLARAQHADSSNVNGSHSRSAESRPPEAPEIPGMAHGHSFTTEIPSGLDQLLRNLFPGEPNHGNDFIFQRTTDHAWRTRIEAPLQAGVDLELADRGINGVAIATRKVREKVPTPRRLRTAHNDFNIISVRRHVWQSPENEDYNTEDYEDYDEAQDDGM
ncbi:mechanosensitive ion channel protein 2, chloroplastic-like protein isoform X1 [Tanacetum coccineum]